MASASIEDMQAMVSSLQQFAGELDEHCQELTSAVSDCIDNMNDDNNVQTAAGKVSAIVSKIKQASGTARQIAAQLQQEIQRILDTRSAMSNGE